MLVVNHRLQIPLAQLRFSFSRSRGPGGQNVNKVNTKAMLRWAVSSSPSISEGVRERFLAKFRRRVNKEGDLVITSQRFRNQGRNVADCLAKLRQMLADVTVAPTKRKPVKPTKAAQQKRRRRNEALSRKKERRRRPILDD